MANGREAIVRARNAPAVCEVFKSVTVECDRRSFRNVLFFGSEFQALEGAFGRTLCDEVICWDGMGRTLQ